MITIRQVAEQAGVSPSTVSRVLNGKASRLVSPETRERVMAVAGELGYQPSAAARTMVTGRTHVVAIVCEEITQPHYTRMIDTARSIVGARGYHLLLASEGKERGTAVESLLGRRQADLVLHVTYPVEAVDLYAGVSGATNNHRLIALGPMAKSPPLKVMAAYWDDRRGIHKAVEHLAELGHERVAFLSGSAARYKQRAFEASADELGLHGTSIDHEHDDDQLAAGAQMTRRALQLEPAPTAIIARNDEFALAALHVLDQEGYSVPGDISVIGYNDIPAAAYTIPALTTIRTPVAECARAVLQSALSSLDESTPDSEPEVHAFGFDTRLVARESTGPPPVGHGR